ncbi:MAG: hypothetical protein KA215_08995 [Flavobacterium sp.]|jgi:hypothetical protein|nr:hypothetical protein [Flavobacterium sp.]
MGLPELKQKIQMQIESADERLLRIVSSVFDNYLNENEAENSMSLQERDAIDEALFQVANKQTISNEVVMEETKKRYPKYFKDDN